MWVDLVPGITAMQALVARSGTPLVEGTETLALVPATARLDTLATITDIMDTVVVYKGGRRLPEVVALLRSRGREAVLGFQLGLEDEHILQLGDLVDGQQAPYLSIVLAREGNLIADRLDVDDLDGARARLGNLCGRDPSHLDV